MSKEDITKEDIKSLEKGLSNLYKHINNLKEVYGLNVVVAINKFHNDTDREIEYLSQSLRENNISFAVTTGYSSGSDGSLDLAKKVIEAANKDNHFKFIYEDSDDIKTKIFKVANKIYGAEEVEYTKEAEKEIEIIEKNGHSNLPICIAKTQYSLSDDPKNLNCQDKFNIHVKEAVLKAGAEFIVVLTGKIMTMPGLPKIPNSENIDIINNQIEGIF